MSNQKTLIEEKVMNEDVLNKMEIIRKNMPAIFAEDSESYRQKLVYNLLNIIRSGNMQQFLWTLLRHLNAKRESSEAKEVIGAVNELYGYSSKFFEKWAYSVIMGIMETKSSEKKEES